LICLSGHVFGSLLTSAVEWNEIRTKVASPALRHVTDVGVSYMMVAGCAAAVLLTRGWMLLRGSLVLGASCWSRW
jgi:hypothetical protein